MENQYVCGAAFSGSDDDMVLCPGELLRQRVKVVKLLTGQLMPL